MNYYIALVIFGFGLTCNPTLKELPENPEDLLFQQKDKEIIEEVFNLFTSEKEAPTSVLMVKVADFFLGTPYLAHTLESEEEQLIINLREMDCTTFAEYCLAVSRTLKSERQTFVQFAAELQKIRYRNGIIDGYPSRLHYFCDWIFDNQKKGVVLDRSRDIAQTPFRKQINFMSTHPESYSQLKSNTMLTGILAEQEKEISKREMFFIPESRIAEAENKLMDGDIAGITTGTEGIDVSHVGILIRKEGRIHLIHASSVAEKVVVSETTLEEYLLNSKAATGIMVARPL